MKGQGGDAWFEHKLPVVAALTVVREPVSVALLAEFSRVADRARVRDVLHEWSAFVERRQPAAGDHPGIRYRLYHASFHDFLSSKPEVSELNLVENRIIDDTLGSYGRKRGPIAEA